MNDFNLISTNNPDSIPLKEFTYIRDNIKKMSEWILTIMKHTKQLNNLVRQSIQVSADDNTTKS